MWLRQLGASGPGCAGLRHVSEVVVDLTPTELDVVPSSLLHHSTSCEAPPQSPPLVPFAFGCGVPLMRVVADAGYAWGFLFGASCVFMCRYLLTFARAWRFVLQWLVSHTPVCSFATFFEITNTRRVNFFHVTNIPRKAWPCPLASQFVCQRLRVVFESACDSLSQQASNFLE